jgi:hypothetical protein
MLSDMMGSSAAAFDPAEVFNDRKKSTFDRIYRAAGESCQGKDYTAQGTLEGEVNIRRIS